MRFKEWLQLKEVGTGTNAVAVFARPISSGGEDHMFRRVPLDMIGGVEMKRRKKKNNKH